MSAWEPKVGDVVAVQAEVLSAMPEHDDYDVGLRRPRQLYELAPWLPAADHDALLAALEVLGEVVRRSDVCTAMLSEHGRKWAAGDLGGEHVSEYMVALRALIDWLDKARAAWVATQHIRQQ